MTKKRKAKSAVSKKTARPNAPQQLDGAERFDILLEESENFCQGIGLHKDLIREILRTDSDWAFILKIDALLESAAKQILRTGLRIKLLNQVFQNETLDGFVDALPMNGRTGLLKLLDASCLPEEIGFVETIRKVRNTYAHDIRFADVSLIELVKQRNDKSQLIKYLSAIETYVESDLIARYERDPGFLRFCVIDSTMRFLFYAYHLAVKSPIAR
ncbi:MAG TPA: hypothetical protein VL127_00940 [Bryobacteraceae bacterium]|nr:hypothetical protein [Bryobacteraceae bacterium]